MKNSFYAGLTVIFLFLLFASLYMGICTPLVRAARGPVSLPAVKAENVVPLDWTSPTTNDLYSVFMVGVNDGWAVGSGGTIIRWDGSSWSTITSPTTQGLNSVFMIGASDGWAVGTSGTIVHWDGSSWSTVTSPTTNILFSVFMVGASNGWAVGILGTIVQWDGASWTAVSSPTTTALNSLFINDVFSYPHIPEGWSVGDLGTILHWDASGWSQATSPTAEGLSSVSMASAVEAWAVGQGGTIIRYVTPAWIIPFSVTIWSWNPAGWLSDTPIYRNGNPTGYNTPYTFNDVTAGESFSVPSVDSHGYPFDCWSTGDTGTSLVVTSAGTYTAQYGSYHVYIEAYDPVGGAWSQIAEPVTMDGGSTGFSTPHTFTGLVGSHTFAVPSTDVHGYPFAEWDNLYSTTTITVDSMGTYRAVYMYPLTVSLTPTSWTMDIGQSKVFTATASGGTTGTTAYWWHVDSMYQIDVSSSTLDYVPSSAGPHTIDVSAYNPITFPDSMIHIYSNEVVAAITVNFVLSAPSVSASPGTVNQGQSSTLSVTGLSGGTTPYSYQWLQKAPGAGSYSPITGATSSTYVFSTSSSTATGEWSFEVQVTDSASSPMTVTSPAALGVVQVVPEFSSPALLLFVMLASALALALVKLRWSRHTMKTSYVYPNVSKKEEHRKATETRTTFPTNREKNGPSSRRIIELLSVRSRSIDR